MNRKKFEQYKKMLRFFATMLLVTFLVLIFIKFWINAYNEGIVLPFHYKGYWMVSAFYVFFNVLFLYIYGGTSYGYLTKNNVIFSQILSLLCANVLIYLETVLLSAKFVNVLPMLKITVIQAVLTIIYSYVVDKLFRKLFPPHRITVLYQEYDPNDMLRKVKTRGDRYFIKNIVNVNQDWDQLRKIIDSSEAIMVYDVHSELRNRIVKYCYEKSIRLYVTPKISDILVRSSENIHLFDTPLLLFRNNGLTCPK